MPTVRQNSLTAYGENAAVDPVLSRVGIQVVEEFWQHMIFMGKLFQVRAGTITTPLVGQAPLTDQAAEVAINALAGGLIIPAEMQISIRLGTGTLHNYALKSVAGAATTANFAPLPLRSDGGPCAATACVSASGGVTTPAELATTTLRHWEYANPLAAAAGNDPGNVAEAVYRPRTSIPILVGARTLYLQMGATGTGPSYYMHIDFLDDPSKALV